MPNSQPIAPIAGDAADFIKDGDSASFMQDVIEVSQKIPVIVDFWAPWCGPCKQLGPVLESAVEAQKGKVRLVKINVDQNQQLAASMRVQSIPSVFIFYGGRPVDGFAGALPESQIREIVEKLGVMASGEADHENIPSLLTQAAAFLIEGKLDHATALYLEALKIDPENPEAYIGLIRSTAAEGLPDEVQELVSRAPARVRESKDWAAIEKMMELSAKAVEAGPLDELKKKRDTDPKNHQARHDYAMALYAGGRKEEAVDELLEIVRRDRKWNDECARKELVTIFEALGSADPLTIDARKRLSSILFA